MAIYTVLKSPQVSFGEFLEDLEDMLTNEVVNGPLEIVRCPGLPENGREKFSSLAERFGAQCGWVNFNHPGGVLIVGWIGWDAQNMLDDIRHMGVQMGGTLSQFREIETVSREKRRLVH